MARRTTRVLLVITLIVLVGICAATTLIIEGQGKECADTGWLLICPEEYDEIIEPLLTAINTATPEQKVQDNPPPNRATNTPGKPNDWECPREPCNTPPADKLVTPATIP